MDLAAAITAMPNAAPLAGPAQAWHWAKVPGFDFAAALSSDGKHLFQLYALDSYDEGLVTAVLVFAREHEAELIAAPDRPLALAEGFAPAGSGFDMVAAVGPGVHKYHEKDGPLHEATRAVFPAYRCEFSGAEDEDEVAYRYSRAAGVTPTRLGREPRPVLKIRYRPDDGSAMDERVYFTPSSLQYQFPKLQDEPDRFVEFENYQQRVWRVEWHGTWTVAELTGDAGERRELGLEELLEFAKTALYGPNLAAGTSEFTKKH
ncbi:MAG TPA: hypothetical protein VFU73_01610 [Actinocrinis sp.]|nr:hypothetical protein [Actinocrinis sp.]